MANPEDFRNQQKTNPTASKPDFPNLQNLRELSIEAHKYIIDALYYGLQSNSLSDEQNLLLTSAKDRIESIMALLEPELVPNSFHQNTTDPEGGLDKSEFV